MDRESFREGGPEYFREVVRSYGPLVLAVARSYARDPDHAEDLFQEVWKKVYEKRRSFSGRGSFEAWLYRLASRVCISDHRARRAHAQAVGRLAHQEEGRTSLSPEANPAGDAERRELHGRLHRAMGSLSARELEAITLRILEGKTAEEVAAMMGIRKSTVRSIIRHGITRLRTFLEVEGDELSGHQLSH